MTKPGAQEWFSAGELADLCLPGLPATKRGMQMQIAREGWEKRECDMRGALARKRQARGGGVEYHVSLLPEAARAKLMAGQARPHEDRPDRESAWLRWERLPESVKAQARYRQEVLAKVEFLVGQGLGKIAAVDHVVGQVVREARLNRETITLCSSTVHGWFSLISGVPLEDRLAYLAPAYQGRIVKSEIPQDAWEIYKADYLRLSKPTHQACYRDLQRIASDRGWSLPHPRTFQRRLEAEIPHPVMILYREGEKALSHAFPHRDRDRSSIAPMQVLNLDGHTWDVMVRWPDGVISRPLSLAVQDIASGKMLAIRFDLTLNHHLVRLALGDTFRQYGICDTLLMDNGRENAAAAISGGQHRLRWGKTPEEEPAGLLKTLGVKAVFATPYWGQAKPIERGFRNFAHDIAKRPEFEGAYTGHNPVAKPENYGSRAVPFAEFEAIVRRELEFYNAQEGRKGQGMNGRSFDQVFAEGMARRPAKRLTNEQLRLCMLASKPVSMDPRSGTVTIEGHRYWSSELGDLPRQKVVARFDPERMDLPVAIYALNGKLLAEASRVAAGNFDNLSDGREQRRNLRDFKRGAKLQASALRALSAQDVAANLMAPAPPAAPMPDSNVVAITPSAPRRADQVAAAEIAKRQKEFEAAQNRALGAIWNAG